MKNLFVICCLIAAFFFSAIHAQTLCETLSLRAVGGDKSEQTFVSLWVNASFVLYAANPSFGAYFSTVSDATLSAHVSFYGSIIGCSAFDASVFPPVSNSNMTDVHSNLTIPAADFEAYVELTREALQKVVPDVTVGEVTQFYQIFESFHESNSTKTICNQADCQSDEAIIINATNPISFFRDAYIPTSSSSLTIQYDGNDAADLYYVSAFAADCTSAALLQNLVPGEAVQTLDLPFPASGVYYVFERTASECFVNTTLFNTSVLILDFTKVVAPPVDAPIDAPVAPPVNNETVPVAPPVAGNDTVPVAAPISSNDTVPVSTPVAPPVNNDTLPVDPPVDAPVQAPVQAPVDTPVYIVPISAPVSDGSITPSASNEFRAGGYIAGIVILVLIVIGLLIAVIIMGVKLRRNSTVVVA